MDDLSGMNNNVFIGGPEDIVADLQPQSTIRLSVILFYLILYKLMQCIFLQIHTDNDIEAVSSMIPRQLTSLCRAKDIHQLDFKPDGTVSAKLEPGDPSSFPVRVNVEKKGVGAGK